jgi:hypothetical protein
VQVSSSEGVANHTVPAKARYGWNSATLPDERASNRERKAQPEAGQYISASEIPADAETGRPSPTSRSIRAWITATESASGACLTC